jgi:RNA polymerase sigma factor (sigma-70 family)
MDNGEAYSNALRLNAGGWEQPAENTMPDKRAAYEQLIAPLESQMMRTIWRVVRHQEWAEDTLQEALTTIWKKLRYVCHHPNPRALVLKICLNAAYDTLRKRRRQGRPDELSDLTRLAGPSQERLSSALERKEIEQEVLKAVGELPRKQAAAVLMRIIEECPYDVIAGVLGCSETTARIHVFRGRASLIRRLAHLDPASFEER